MDTSAPADTADPDGNVNNNDNGIGTGAGQVSSGVLDMLPETGTNFTITPGNTTDFTVDFGFTKAYSLGNRVWYDTNNDGDMDPGENGIDGVRMNLYRDTNLNGAYDGGDAAVANMLTAGGGYYRFDNLTAGEYMVVIPNDNFTNDGSDDALVGYWSSGTSIDGNGLTSDTFGPTRTVARTIPWGPRRRPRSGR